MKKILSFVLSVLFVVSCMTVPTFAAEKEAKASITEEQFGILKTTGAAIEGSANQIPDGAIQRGVAARRFAKYGNFRYSTAKEYEALFYDLSTDNYYYYYIKGCYDNGVMNGYPDGTFRPDAPISTLEAAKVVLYTLGYKDYVNAMGVQYVMNMTGLLDGISEISDAMTYHDFYRMLYNGYMAPYCKATEFTSDGGVKCTIDENYTGLEHLWGIKKGNGVVDGATATLLERPDDSMLDNMISIDGKRYMFNVGNSTDYLGYNVDYYYKTGQENKTDGNEIVYICKTSKNKTLELKHDVLESYDDFKLRYVKNNRYETVELDVETDVIYNGVATPMFTAEEMLPKFGKVTLIDNDKERGYDVVLVENHEFFLVESVDALKLKFTEQDEDVAPLELENADLVSIKWDGADYPAERIVKGNLLKIQRTKPDCGYYVCNIEVFKNEKNNVTVIKANDDFVYESIFEHPIWTYIDMESKELLKSGNIVTLYMYNGTVVRVISESGDSSKLGYIMNAAAEGTFDKTLSMRIMDQNATATSYNVANRVKIDENSLDDADDILAYLNTSARTSAYYGDEAPYAQPVRFKTNDAGEITWIDTRIFDEKENKDTALEFAEGAITVTDRGSFYRDFNSGVIYGSSHEATFRSAPLKVPLDPAQRLDEANYSSRLYDSEYYQVEVFNLEMPIRIADYGVVYTGTIGVSGAVTYSNNHDPVIIYEKNADLNEDGDVDYTLETYYRRDVKTYKYRAEDIDKFEVLKTCDVGDIVQIHEDKYGYIDGIKLVYDVSEFVPADQRLFTWGAGGSAVPISNGYKAVYTTPVDKDGSYIRITTTHPEDDTGINYDYQADTFVPSAGKIYKYTNVRGQVTIETATMDDIVTYNQSKTEFTPVIFVYNHNTGGLNNLYIISK